MSFLSIIGMILFMVLLKVFKDAIIPHFASKEFTYTNPETKEEVNVPAMPANYTGIVAVGIVGLIFLGFVMIATVQLWDVSIFNTIIKL